MGPRRLVHLHGSASDLWRRRCSATERRSDQVNTTERTNTPTNTTRVAPTPRGSAPSICHLRPAFPTWPRLLASAHHAAQPPGAQQLDLERRRAGRHSPTKSTLCTASIDAIHPTNAPHLGPGTLPAAPRPAARRRPAPRPPSPPSLPGKRRRNPPSRKNWRGATPCTHTGCKQRPVPATTIPTPWTRSMTVSTERETVAGA